MAFEQEAAFETALINLLTEKYGWEPEILRYKTEEELIQNWKQILFENNRDVDRLNDVPLTDGEMQQILDQITRLRTPLKLNGFINGVRPLLSNATIPQMNCTSGKKSV